MPFGQLGSLGSEFGGLGGSRVGGSGTPVVRPDAPVLTWTSASSVTTPTFSSVFGDLLVVGDVITLQQATDVGFFSPTSYAHTIAIPDIIAGSFAYGNSALVNGTYYFREKISHNSVDSLWSNTETVTILDTAANITSPNTDSVPSSQLLAHALTADKSVTWSITGGADAAQFAISVATLEWVGNGSQNFATPADANTDNIYVVQVTATTTAGTPTNQTISVTVTNPTPAELRSDGGHILRVDGGRILRS